MAEGNETENLNKALARENWKHKREQVDTSHDYTIQFGHAAIKAPGVANMAAFAAFLGFLSANAIKLTGKLVMVEACFFWFALGVVTSALATGGAYFTQYAYTAADNSYDVDWKHPYVVVKPHWTKWFSIVLHICTVALVALSYFSLIWGAWWFLDLTKAIFS